MIANQTEVLSNAELRRRLKEIHESTCHLRLRLPVENPYNKTVTLQDIARYVGASSRYLRHIWPETPPARCTFECPSVQTCRKTPPCRNIQAYLQKRLTDFFRGFDAGRIVKARVGETWQLVDRRASVMGDSPLAQVAAAQGTSLQTRTITGRIDLTVLGPRLKL